MNAPPRKLALAAALAALLAAVLAALHVPGLGPALAGGGSPLGPLVSVLAPAEAYAERLEFEEVPAESVSAFERRRARARERARETAQQVRDEVRSRVREAVQVAREAQAPEPPVPPVPPGEDGDVVEITDEPRTITLSSKSGNITRIGSDIEITEDQVVVGDVVAVGGDVTVAGRVEGDVAAMGGDVHLTSTARVEGDVVCMGGRLVEDEGAEVGGQRVSGLGSPGSRVTVQGDDEIPRQRGRGDEDRVIGGLISLLLALGAAWIFAGLGGGRTTAAAATLRRAPLLCAGIGGLVFALIVPSLVALALVVALLCITIIGIPVALAALLAYFLFLFVVWVWGYVIAASVVGQWALGRRSPAVAGAIPPPAPSILRGALIGVLILSGAAFVGRLLQAAGPLGGIGTLIGVLSWIAFALAVLLGSGAWIRSELETGTLMRWWRGNQWGRSKAPAPAPAAAAPPSPEPPPVPPAYAPPPPAPAPPSAYMPPEPRPGTPEVGG
jgi:hypothetical protein